MDFNAEVRDWIRGFVDRDVRPVVHEMEARPDADIFPWDIVEKANAVGIGALTLSEASGGGGFGLLAAAMTIEELARGDAGIAMTLSKSLHGAELVEQFGSDSQRRRVLGEYLANGRALFTVSADGPEGGLSRDADEDATSPEATAQRIDGGWIVNGVKRFVLNADKARYLVVFVPWRGSSRDALTACLLLESGHAGLETGPARDTVGRRLAREVDLHFTDCYVPDEDALGSADKAGEILAQALRAGNLFAAACAVGVAGAACEQAVAWTRQRVQGGKPLIEHDTVAVSLGRMKMQLDAARAYLHLACNALDHPGERDGTLGLLPKVLASQTAWRVAVEALELHGGWGYMREVPMEKLVRDAASLVAWDEPNRQLLLEAGRRIKASDRAVVAGID